VKLCNSDAVFTYHSPRVHKSQEPCRLEDQILYGGAWYLWNQICLRNFPHIHPIRLEPRILRRLLYFLFFFFNRCTPVIRKHWKFSDSATWPCSLFRLGDIGYARSQWLFLFMAIRTGIHLTMNFCWLALLLLLMTKALVYNLDAVTGWTEFVFARFS
jgi:hypothetical protein